MPSIPQSYVHGITILVTSDDCWTPRDATVRNGDMDEGTPVGVGDVQVSLPKGDAVPVHRHRLLVAAAGLFLVAGVLGILSIGIIFLLFAAVSAVAAGRSAASNVASPEHA